MPYSSSPLYSLPAPFGDWLALSFAPSEDGGGSMPGQETEGGLGVVVEEEDENEKSEGDKRGEQVSDSTQGEESIDVGTVSTEKSRKDEEASLSACTNTSTGSSHPHIANANRPLRRTESPPPSTAETEAEKEEREKKNREAKEELEALFASDDELDEE